MNKTIIKWTILILLFSYTAAITIWAHSRVAMNSCREIEVRIAEGTVADSVTRIGVLKELKRFPSKIIGTPVQQVNIHAIENFLSSFSNFEEVDVAISSDGVLQIDVLPMVPEMRVFSGSESYYINKDGKRMDSNAHFFVDVPVVCGDFNDTFRPEHVLPICRFVSNDPELRRLTGMIQARDADNIYLVPRIAGQIINFGDTCRLEEKKKALFTMYHKVMPYKGWNEYDTISVRFRNQIVATRRNKTLSDHGAVIDDGPDLEEATLPSDEI